VERAFHECGINTFFVVSAMKELAKGVRSLARQGHRNEMVIISVSGPPAGFGIRSSWERNARALGVDVIDVLLVGWVKTRWYITNWKWPEMRRLKEEGKVRALGFSSHDRMLAVELTRELDPDVLMIRYNAAHRGAEREIFEPLGAGRPGIVSYTATRWGMLLRGVPQGGFPQTMTPPECYRFVLGNPSVDLALCGARSFEELREDVAGVLEGPLDFRRQEEARRYGDAVHAAARGGRRWMFRQG
jgi:aryl-alcohol dehydrogenase-like predicted oxidoreductase